MEFTLRRFLLGIAGTMTFNGIFTATGLWLLGIPFAIPLGIITALLNFIPNIGPIIAGVPAVLIALSQSPTQAIYVFILYLAAQNLDGFVITPMIQQRAVSIPDALFLRPRFECCFLEMVSMCTTPSGRRQALPSSTRAQCAKNPALPVDR